MRPVLELHPNITNLGPNLAPPDLPRLAPFVVELGNDTSDLAACGSACAAFEDAPPADPLLTRCQSFTRFTATGRCFGHLDPTWIPLSGIDSSGFSAADSGVVVRACETDGDCSYNGRCASGGTCSCSQGWKGRRCQTLDLLPVDKHKLGFAPTDARGQNESSWGGSILHIAGTWHGWFAKMANYCGIGQWTSYFPTY